jgi:hypothetical protein
MIVPTDMSSFDFSLSCISYYLWGSGALGPVLNLGTRCFFFLIFCLFSRAIPRSGCDFSPEHLEEEDVYEFVVSISSTRCCKEFCLSSLLSVTRVTIGRIYNV